MISLKIGGIIMAAFVAGAFVASPELRAYAANTIGSADIINNSIQSVDIKDGEVKTDDIAPGAIGSLRIKDNDVKAQDLAPDSVGASEIIGVTKLEFTTCSLSSGLTFSPGGITVKSCPVPGVTTADKVIVTKESGNACFLVYNAATSTDTVYLYIRNYCATNALFGTQTFALMVYKPG